MPNPLNVLTKPLQLGAQLAFGVIQNVQKAVQGLTGGHHHEVPPQPAPRRPAKPKPLDDATITAKTSADTPRTQQKTRQKKSTAAARKRAPKRTTSQRKTSAASKAEPAPKDVAAKGAGRQTAPLGSSSSGNGDGKSS